MNAQHLVSKFIRFLRGLRPGLAHATIKPRVESGAGPKLTNIQLQLVAQLTPGKCELAHNSAAKPHHVCFHYGSRLDVPGGVQFVRSTASSATDP